MPNKYKPRQRVRALLRTSAEFCDRILLRLAEIRAQDEGFGLDRVKARDGLAKEVLILQDHIRAVRDRL